MPPGLVDADASLADRRRQSTLMPALRMTGPSRSISDLIFAANSSGELATTSTPELTNFSFTAGERRGTVALVRNLCDVHVRHAFEELHRHLRSRPGRARAVVKLSRPRTCERDEVFHRTDRQRWMHQQYRRRAHRECYGREVLQRI